MASELPVALQQFLATQTPEQLLALATAVEKLARDDETSTVTPKKTTKTKMAKRSTTTHPKGSKLTVNLPNVVIAAKRPLNSFFAFRAYYKSAFVGLQQKHISGYLHQLWAEDCFKNKWVIVAKAYSVIRDSVGKQNAPLDKFFEIVVDKIGLIHADEYFSMMGWMKPDGNEKEMIRQYSVDVSMLPAHLQANGVSVDDLVKYAIEVCKYTGGIQNGKSNDNLPVKSLLTILDNMDAGTQETIAMTINPTLLTMSSISTNVQDLSSLNVIGNGNIIDSGAVTDNVSFSGPKFATASLFDSDEDLRPIDADPLKAMKENEFALVNSGDSYPFNTQFEPADLDSGMCLDFEPLFPGEFEAGQFEFIPTQEAEKDWEDLMVFLDTV